MAGRGDIILHKTRLATAIPTIKEKKIMVGLWLSLNVLSFKLA